MPSEEILCRHCHRYYPLSKIVGSDNRNNLISTQKEGHELPVVEGGAPWAAVRPSALPITKTRRRIFGKKKDPNADEAEAERARRAQMGYDPYCPYLHVMIDGMAEKPFVVTVAGNVGASKTTYRLGLMAGINRTGKLGPFPIQASFLASQVEEIDKNLHSLFGEEKLPGPTQLAVIDDGYVVRLQWPTKARRNLALYDVPGEVISDKKKAAERGRFLFSSDAIILIIDPDGFPDEKAFMRPRVAGVKLTGHQQVHVLADGIEEIKQQVSDTLARPIVIAVGKADKVDWDDVGLRAEFDAITDRDGLMADSDAVRSYLNSHGMGNIVDAAEARFGSSVVRYTRFSALGRDSDQYPEYDDDGFSPSGCWKPIVHALDLAGLIA